MDVSELTAWVNQAIAESPGAVADDPGDLITLSIPEPRRHDGERVKVFGRHGPYARVVCGSRGRLTVSVSARRLRAWLVKHGLWEAEESRNP